MRARSYIIQLHNATDSLGNIFAESALIGDDKVGADDKKHGVKTAQPVEWNSPNEKK